MKIKDIPNAKKNGVKWLMASGVKTKEEALELAAMFVENVEDVKEDIRKHGTVAQPGRVLS